VPAGDGERAQPDDRGGEPDQPAEDGDQGDHPQDAQPAGDQPAAEEVGTRRIDRPRIQAAAL
jgi:hypothetical protein